MITKACNLNEDEIKALIITYASEITEDSIEDSLDRMNYLNKRLKTFNEPDPKPIPETVTSPTGW